MKKPLIVLTGPTAAGKTELSIALAKAVGGEIISADSIQIYKYMDIGSAKITQEEMQGVPHYLVDQLEPSEEFNIFRFQHMAKAAMEDIYSRGHIPILVGGTGFYIQSVLYDIAFSEEEGDKSIREKYQNMLENQGVKAVFEVLKAVDPVSAETIHPQNTKRVIRAIEYFEQTGQPISKHNEEQREKESPYNFCYFVLNRERDTLYERINRRVDIMMEQGLLKEVEKLKNMGFSQDLVSMQGIGYKEVYQHLLGNCTLEEAVEQIKLDTRRFAKRQLTWFRREKTVTWMNYEDYDNDINQMLAGMLEECKRKEIINE